MMNHHEAGLSDAQAKAMYRWILLARRLDERFSLLQRSGAIPLAVSSRGHEVAQVGAAMAFQKGDWWFPYYRDLGAVLVAGATPRDLMLASFGRAADPASGGRQTPYNWGNRRHNIVARSAPVGVQVPQAAGVALAARNRGEKIVVYCSLGEGAASQGDVHEGLNWASLRWAPVVYLCQNNGWAISVPATKQAAGGSIAARAASYGIPGTLVDGTDPFAVFAATSDAVNRAREGGGPTLIEARVLRLDAHTCDDNQALYRGADELRTLPDKDPLRQLRTYLLATGCLTEPEESTLEGEITGQLDEAEAEARQAAYPTPDW